MIPENFIDELKTELRYPLPGERIQQLMAPSFRNQLPETSAYSNAGVMVLLYPISDCFYTVFMKRATYPGMHSGQISLPGGKFDQSDTSLLNTALRETHEEFGINPNDIEIVGSLTPLSIPVSGFRIFPFIGYLKLKPDFITDPKEVDYLIEVKLNDLFAPANTRAETQIHRNFIGEVPYYFVSGEKIWGATAMVLREFQEICFKCTNSNY